MGYRSGKEIADVIDADKPWRRVLGARVPQIDLPHLVCVLAETGIDVLCLAVLASASEGVETLHFDGDSSLLKRHGKQQGAADNGHDKAFGYHAEWMLANGARIGSYRDEAAQEICPEQPKVGGAVAFGGFRHAVKSWGTGRRVVVKWRVPETKGDAAALFAERFYFVTNRSDAPAALIEHDLGRGEAERRFDEFEAAFEPTFRHAEMAKNEAWAQRRALAHNTLVDLRAKVDGGTEIKPRPTQKPIRGESGWSVLATTFVMARV